MNKLEVKEEVQKLIQKYDRLEKEGKLKDYNEERTKKDFILPLFRILGWSIEDGDEVTAEEKISKGRVDYAFRIDGIPKLFLEAKAINVSIDKTEFAEQAINYAWHKGATWAVLTDFNGIKIFNAEWKSQNPLQNLFFSLKYYQFIDNLEQLLLLSRESLSQGTIDKEAEKWGKKTKKVPVDKQLLNDLTKFREILNKNILKNNTNKKLNDEQLEESVQRILDRLIFIRTLEDKQLEPPLLNSLIRENKTKKIHTKLNELFRKIDDVYNSKLFYHHLCEDLLIDDEPLEKIIKGLFKTEDNTVYYDFSAIDADVLGTMYEQYLGNILKKTSTRGKLTEEKTHRKEQGIYYTPTYIVDYIIKNTVGELAKNKKLDMKAIKILDPSCGSGSFLMKSFDYLITLDKTRNKDTEQTKLDTTGITASYGRKVEILKNNIYGVDLDPKAVEIAQLNLLLKTAEKKHRLPTLQENIKVGNSLINDPLIAQEKAFKWEEQFKEIIKNGGFDIIIGNPPYINAIQLTKSVGEPTKKYWKEKYESARGTYDIYILFFEQALKVCKEGGLVSFITPNKYLSSPYGAALREFITKNYTLVKVIDLSQVRVFNDPSVYPVITIIQKTKPKKEYTIITEKILSQNIEEKKIYKVSSKTLTSLPENLWGIILSNNISLIEKAFSKGLPLEEAAVVQATSTAAEADEYSNYIGEKIKGLPIINTGTIDRYNVTYGINKFMNKGKKIEQPVLDITRISETRKNLYRSPKIIIAKLALRIEGFLDEKGAYASINTNCIHTPKKEYPIEYLIGIVNSKLLSFIYSELFSGLKMSGGYFQFQAPQIRILPIAKATLEQQKEIESLVKKRIFIIQKLNILQNKATDEKTSLEKESKELDNKIDQAVYKIYGITKEEQAVVEGSFQ